MKRHKADTFTVSFRLVGHDHALLSERARALEKSPGEYARTLVRDALYDQHAKQMLDELSELKHQLQSTLLELNRHLRTATIGLLTDAGKASLEAAQEWVDKYLAD